VAKWHVLDAPNGDCYLQDQMLIVRYDEGDCDVVNRHMEGFMKHLHHALYDEYQCSDVMKDGDEICLYGRVRFRCEGVHVVEMVGV